MACPSIINHKFSRLTGNVKTDCRHQLQLYIPEDDKKWGSKNLFIP